VVAGGLLLVAAVPKLRAASSVALVACLLAGLVASGAIAFRSQGLLVDVATPAIAWAVVFALVLAGTLGEADRQRRQLRLQAARVAGELDAARRIQMGLLPLPRVVFAHEPRVDLDALLEPARSVGGDLYDCFMVDDRRLFLVVGDVSGKGLPAALFMASVKSLAKNAALRGEEAVGDWLARANGEILRENPESLFVTAFAALLDLADGTLEFSNAGHEPPWVRRPGGAPRRLEHEGGPPLGVLEDFAYPTARHQFAAGEWLCVVTDGVTEAMNARRELYGSARLKSVLEAVPEGAEAGDVIAAVKRDVAAFVGVAEVADDLTLMVLRWKKTGSET